MGVNPINSNDPAVKTTNSFSTTNSSKMKYSLFAKWDTNHDYKISDEELEAAGYTGKDLAAMSQAIFFAERDVNKWFKFDKNKDGTSNNVEDELWTQHNQNDYHKNGDMTLEEFAKKNGMTIRLDEVYDNFEDWCKWWIEQGPSDAATKKIIKKQYGKELSDKETELLYEAMKYQANRWLFKQDSLYERCNSSAYTRLITDDCAVSCCGGDISQPPIGKQPKIDLTGKLIEKGCGADGLIFSSMEYPSSTNNAEETKNRLAWAAFKTVPKVEAAKMTPIEYFNYQKTWNAVRNMKASDYRALLLPENSAKREKFEANSNMTVKQIVEYIDIVESTTGKNFDSNDWIIDSSMFKEIVDKINGTYGEGKILKGKTRADIPQDRQEWLNYLESHGLLLDQFKE